MHLQGGFGTAPNVATLQSCYFLGCLAWCQRHYHDAVGPYDIIAYLNSRADAAELLPLFHAFVVVMTKAEGGAIYLSVRLRSLHRLVHCRYLHTLHCLVARLSMSIYLAVFYCSLLLIAADPAHSSPR